MYDGQRGGEGIYLLDREEGVTCSSGTRARLEGIYYGWKRGGGSYT